MRILFCNIGWMERYRGMHTGASIKGGGAFVVKEDHGLEVCNFEDHEGFAFGYVKTPGKKLDMMRIPDEDSDSIDGVLIVWIAPLGGRAPAVVVGWYEDATVFRTYRRFDSVPPVHEENGVDGYRFRVVSEKAVLLPVDSRTHVIPKHKKGLMGEANIWYADTPQAMPVVEGVLALINGTVRTPARRRGKTDPQHNAKVEKAAVKAVRRHYKKLGYAVESVERDNVGWDLEARLGDRVQFRIEVKGLSGSEPRVGLTPNEYGKFEENAEDYRLAHPLHRSASVEVVTSFNRSDCYRLERQLPGGVRTHWVTAPFHGARIGQARCSCVAAPGMLAQQSVLEDMAPVEVTLERTPKGLETGVNTPPREAWLTELTRRRLGSIERSRENSCAARAPPGPTRPRTGDPSLITLPTAEVDEYRTCSQVV